MIPHGDEIPFHMNKAVKIMCVVLALHVMPTGIYAQVDDGKKEAIRVETPTDPNLAHTVYIVKTDKNQNRIISIKIRIDKSQNWRDLQKNEDECAKSLKKHGLSKKDGELDLNCIFEVNSRDGNVIQVRKSYQISNDVVILPKNKTIRIGELIARSKRRP